MNKLNIARNPKDIFLEALNNYGVDSNFCIPQKAREIFGKYGANTKFIVLGTKDFASAFLSAIGDKGVPLYAVDDFKCHKGEKFGGLDVISTDKFIEIAKKDPAIVAINCCRFDYSRRFFDEICRSQNIACLNHEQVTRLFSLNSTLDYRLSDWASDIYSRVDEFLALENRLADHYSKETLLRVLTFHVTANPEWYLNISRPYSTLYFRSGLLNFSDDERFVDCGASIGESTEALIGITQSKLQRIWMIEPDKFNIKTLQKLLRKYEPSHLHGKISLHPFAAGECDAEAYFHHMGGHGGLISTVDNPALDKVEIRPIDSIIDDTPTFIKMDIEGAELSALKGSTAAIKAGLPKLAISAYHRSTDLLDIPAFLDAIAPGYKVGLRHHTEDRWDTCLYFYRDI